MSAEKRRFRPLNVSDILDETIDIYKSNFVLLLGVAAILYIPMTLISGLTQNYNAQQSSFDWRTLMQLLPEAIVTGALTFGISERYLGRVTSIVDCYRRILVPRVLFPLLGAMLIKYAIMLVPFFAVYAMMPAVPANPATMQMDQMIRLFAVGALSLVALIWMCAFGVKLLLVEPALIMESRGALSSIGRSWKMMKGFFWKAVGVYLIISLVTGILYLLIVMPALAPVIKKIAIGEAVTMSAKVLPTILQTIIVTLIVPLMAATRILFYYDVRIRREGFDLELLANELDQKTRHSVMGDITALPQERASEPASDGEQQ